MPDDKKPPRLPPVHKDWSGVGRSTPAGGTLVIKEGTSKQREDATPIFENVTNEDLAKQVRAVDKKHDEFASVTTQRLATVEARVERVPAIESKVDQMLLLTVEKQAKREIVSMDIERVHAEMQSKKEIVEIEDKADEAKTKRMIKIERVKLWGKILGLVASGGALIHFIEKC